MGGTTGATEATGFSATSAGFSVGLSGTAAGFSAVGAGRGGNGTITAGFVGGVAAGLGVLTGAIGEGAFACELAVSIAGDGVVGNGTLIGAGAGAAGAVATGVGLRSAAGSTGIAGRAVGSGGTVGAGETGAFA